jgi:hypothetical protein
MMVRAAFAMLPVCFQVWFVIVSILSIECVSEKTFERSVQTLRPMENAVREVIA